MTTTGNQGLDALANTIAEVVWDRIADMIRHSADGELLDMKGAAAYLKVDVKSLRKLIHAGKLRPARIGGLLRIDSRDLQKLVEESKEKALP